MRMPPRSVLRIGVPVTAAAVVAMQADGNLVAYHGRTWLWSSQTNGNPGASALFQTDGNLVVYSRAGHPLWASNTNAGTQSFDGAGPGPLVDQDLTLAEAPALATPHPGRRLPREAQSGPDLPVSGQLSYRDVVTSGQDGRAGRPARRAPGMF